MDIVGSFSKQPTVSPTYYFSGADASSHRFSSRNRVPLHHTSARSRHRALECISRLPNARPAALHYVRMAFRVTSHINFSCAYSLSWFSAGSHSVCQLTQGRHAGNPVRQFSFSVSLTHTLRFSRRLRTGHPSCVRSRRRRK